MTKFWLCPTPHFRKDTLSGGRQVASHDFRENPSQLHESPGWALAFSRSLFQASLLPASVLQFLALKTRRSFSSPSEIWPALLRVPIGRALKTFLGCGLHSDNVTCPINSLYFHEVDTVRFLI
ncbi:hypothetical protein TNCV_2883641 [Trichonephila clavipes]|nr:hypothetical protein TNCV_2883641 [Trichonephila clavipes]